MGADIAIEADKRMGTDIAIEYAIEACRHVVTDTPIERCWRVDTDMSIERCCRVGADIAIEVDKRVDTDMAIGMLACGRRYTIEADMPVEESPGLEIRVFRSASVRRADKEGTCGSSVYAGDDRFIKDTGFQSGCRVALPLFL